MKKYQKGDLIVQWENKKCIHSEKCWRGLSSVFKPLERPWIQLEGSEKDQIIKQINQCPSGALSYYVEGQNLKNNMEEKEKNSKIDVLKDGPIMVEGPIEIQNSDGEISSHKKKVFLCRCGASTNKPFCDGSHKKIDFKA